MDPAKELSENLKFLQKCKDLALAHKDTPVPSQSPDLYVSKMWVLGVIMALNSMGYEVKKK